MYNGGRKNWNWKRGRLASNLGGLLDIFQDFLVPLSVDLARINFMQLVILYYGRYYALFRENKNLFQKFYYFMFYWNVKKKEQVAI